MDNNFFYENDVRVTKMAVKVLRWLIIVFPLLILLSAVGIFQSKVSDLIPLTVIAAIVTFGPTVAYKLNAPIGAMKYVTTLALGMLVALMASDPTIGIYMTYALAMVFSIFYFDKKFTRRIAFISFVLLIGSLYFRSINVAQIEFETNFEWFISRSLGFALEATVMSIICVKLAEAAHDMLVKFADTQQTADLVEQCQNASSELSGVVEKLEDCIHGFAGTNDVITESAQATLEDCNNSFKFADSVCSSMGELNETVDVIVENTEKMIKISEETSEKMQGYIDLMEKTTDDMQVVEKSARQTEESITSLEAGMKEVSEFATTIAGITSQTNLLALNASIEAARAGEAGRGFSVVASEISQLSDSSRDTATHIQDINNLIIEAVQQLTNHANELVTYIQETILPDYDSFVDAGMQYSKDANYVNEIVNQFHIMSDELRSQTEQVQEFAESISQSVIESSEGIQNAATNTENLSDEIANISGHILENKEVANTLNREAERFTI